LLGLAAGTICYALFRPISLAAVANAPLLVAPRIFPFGFAIETELVIVFLLVLLPASIGSMALYQMVGDWGGQNISAPRMSQGIFAIGLGGVLAGLFGGFSTIVYPDNIGMLRTTRVGSRYATLTAGILLIVLGASIKFDLLLVVVPLPVLSAAATLLFGIVLMHGVHILAKVDWDDRKFIGSGDADRARRDVHLAGGAGADAASGQAVRHPAGDFRQFDVDRAACAALRHAA
jgi:xanthine/uracil permease